MFPSEFGETSLIDLDTIFALNEAARGPYSFRLRRASMIDLDSVFDHDRRAGHTAPAAPAVSAAVPLPAAESCELADVDAGLNAADCPRWEDCIDPPAPCPRCGSLAVWSPIVGAPRCMTCDPPALSLRLLALAERLRRNRPPRTARRKAPGGMLTRGQQSR